LNHTQKAYSKYITLEYTILIMDKDKQEFIEALVNAVEEAKKSSR